MYVIPNIALAHGGADAHGCGGIVDVDSAQFGHCLMDHADLRPVAVGDGKLIVGFYQIGQRLCGDLDCVPLFQRGIAERFVSKRDDCFLFIQYFVHEKSSNRQTSGRVFPHILSITKVELFV